MPSALCVTPLHTDEPLDSTKALGRNWMDGFHTLFSRVFLSLAWQNKHEG